MQTKIEGNNKPQDTFAWSSYKDVSQWGRILERRRVRFPWIHKREEEDFHCSKIPPWKNQNAVPLWWALRAILWFAEGSGGDSHFRDFSRNCLSVRTDKSRNQQQGDNNTNPSLHLRYSQTVRLLLSHLVVSIFRNAKITREIHFAHRQWAPSLCCPPCSRLEVSTIAIRASSIVSVSSLFSASSTSFLPSSFFTIYSKETKSRAIYECRSTHLIDLVWSPL